MEGIRHWLLGLLTVVMSLSIFYSLVPKGTIRAVMRFTGGIVLMLALLQPLQEIDLADFRVAYDDLSDSINTQIGDYQEEQDAKLQSIIQQKTEAYIQDKAMQSGLTCNPAVDVEKRDGVPYPAAVTIDIPYNHSLSQIITRDLDIPENSQYWSER